MKKIFSFGVVVLLVALTGFYSFAAAQTDDSSDKPSRSTESLETFKKRQEDRKKQFNVALSSAEKTRLKSRCQAAQGKLSSTSQRINGISSSRTKKHDNIVKQLEALVVKLQAKNIDTTKLEAEIVTLKSKISTFQDSLEAYSQAVSDLVELECQEDPDAFKAALLAARSSLEQVKKDSGAVRDQLKATIKPLLVDIRSKLEPANSDNEGDN